MQLGFKRNKDNFYYSLVESHPFYNSIVTPFCVLLLLLFSMGSNGKFEKGNLIKVVTSMKNKLLCYHSLPLPLLKRSCWQSSMLLYLLVYLCPCVTRYRSHHWRVVITVGKWWKMTGKIERWMVHFKRVVCCRGRGIEQLEKTNGWLGVSLKTRKIDREGVGWLVSSRLWRKVWESHGSWRKERFGKKFSQDEKGIKSRNNFMHPTIWATVRENHFVIKCNWTRNFLLYECLFNSFNSFLLLNKMKNFCYQYFAIIIHSLLSPILSCLPLSTLPTVHISVVVTH